VFVIALFIIEKKKKIDMVRTNDYWCKDYAAFETLITLGLT